MESVAAVAARSLCISAAATVLASSWSLPLAYLLATRRRLRGLASVFESLVGVPTVLVGLLLYFLLSRRGPLGFLGLLYTPWAIVIGEAVLVTPLLVAVSYRVLGQGVERYAALAEALGAGRREAMLFALRVSAPGLLAAVVMAFSRAVGELGVALMLGGNIRGYTRTLTTAIALDVAMGEYEEAARLGMVLVALMLAVGAALRATRRLMEP